MECIKEVLHILKLCATEEQRLEYGFLLRALAPPRVKRGDMAGMINKVAARLEVQYGTRFMSRSVHFW